MSDEATAINAEADLREAIRDAYETASRALHDSTEWESVQYPNDKTVYDYFETRLVDAAKCYFYRRSGNLEAALRDEIAHLKDVIEENERQAGRAIDQAKYDAAHEAEKELRNEFRQRGWTRYEW